MQKSSFGELPEPHQARADSGSATESSLYVQWQSPMGQPPDAVRNRTALDVLPPAEVALKILPEIEIIDFQPVERPLPARSAVPLPAFDRAQTDRHYVVTAQRPLFSVDGHLIDRTLDDGSERTEQAHPDGTIRSRTRHPDGRVLERIADRYGRPFYTLDIKPDGSWLVTELTYQDASGKLSPFTASKKLITSDGQVTEMAFDRIGRLSARQDYRAVKLG